MFDFGISRVDRLQDGAWAVFFHCTCGGVRNWLHLYHLKIVEPGECG